MPVDWEHPGQLWTGGGLHAFVVETTGAKTGELRRAVLGYLEEGDDAWLIMGSKGGAPRNPKWVYNLAAHPEATVVLADGERVAVGAQRLDGDDLDRAWERIAVEAPEYIGYLSKTDRVIPVYRLRRARGAS
jgi:deazaflavin-dependent oxidoreductase (nitroreductase family)